MNPININNIFMGGTLYFPKQKINKKKGTVLYFSKSL